MDKKSFLQKPENWMGLLIGGGLAAGAVYGLMAILPILITLASNVILLGAMVAFIIATLAFVVEQRTMITYMWRGLMRKITGFFVELDPIGIMKTYIERLGKHVYNLEEQIKKLRIQIRAVEEKINKSTSKYNYAMKIAEEAQRQGNESEFEVRTTEAGLHQQSINNLTKTRDEAQLILDILDDVKLKCSNKIRTMSSEVEVLSEEREINRAMSNAISSARSILAGNPDERAQYEIGLEKCTEQYARDIGDFEDFLHNTQSFIDSANLESGVFKADALKKIEAMRNKPLLTQKSTIEPIMSKFINPAKVSQ